MLCETKECDGLTKIYLRDLGAKVVLTFHYKSESLQVGKFVHVERITMGLECHTRVGDGMLLHKRYFSFQLAEVFEVST